MFKLAPYPRFSAIRSISLKPPSPSYNIQRLATALKPPSPKKRGFGVEISEDFAKKLKLHEKPAKIIAPVLYVNSKSSNEISADKNSRSEDTGFTLRINRLIGIFNQLNQKSPENLEKAPGNFSTHAKEEIKILLDELLSHSENNTGFLEWVVERRLFSLDAFHWDQDRAYFVKVLSQTCLKHSVFTTWNNFGSAFQDFVIQVWNDTSQQEAEAFCNGIIGQVSLPLKEKAYNAILECLNYITVPVYSRNVGNRLLDEMLELGLSTSNLAYYNIFGLNTVISYLKYVPLKEIKRLKMMYPIHRARIAEFGPYACSLMLFYYSARVKDGPEESIALLELAAALIRSDVNLSESNCQNALEAAERLLDKFYPEWQKQEPEKKTIAERIKLILENSRCIKDIPSTDMFSIFLACYRKLVVSNEEDTINFVSTLLQSHLESGVALETAHLESVLMFYSKAGYSFDLETVLRILEGNNLTPSAKILYAALNLNITQNQPEKALMLYKSIANDKDPELKSLSRFKEFPEVISLMIVVVAKLHDLRMMKDFWESCRKSGPVFSSITYLNVIEGFSCYIKPISKVSANMEFAESYKFISNIKQILETKLPSQFPEVYLNLIKAHSEYCLRDPEANFEDFQHTLKIGLLGYKYRFRDSCYRYTFTAFQHFAKRKAILKPILLTETKQIFINMLKYRTKVSCITYCHLLALVQMLGDDFFCKMILEQFHIAKSKNNLLDPIHASKVMELFENNPKKKPNSFKSPDSKSPTASDQISHQELRTL